MKNIYIISPIISKVNSHISFHKKKKDSGALRIPSAADTYRTESRPRALNTKGVFGSQQAEAPRMELLCLLQNLFLERGKT